MEQARSPIERKLLRSATEICQREPERATAFLVGKGDNGMLRRIHRHRSGAIAATLATLSFVVVTGCGTDDSGGDSSGGSGGTGGTGAEKCLASAGGNLGIDRKPVMDVTAQQQSLNTGATLALQSGALATKATLDTVFTVRNTAQIQAARELRIEKIEVLYTLPANATDDGDPFTCTVEVDGAEKPCADAGVISIVPDGADDKFCTSGARVGNLTIHVRFHKQADNVVRKAVVRISAPGDERYSKSPFNAVLTTKEGTPKLKLSPEVADFGVVKIGACGEKKISMLNSGDAPVLVSRIDVTKTLPKPVSVEIAGKTYKGGETAVFDPPLEVPPQESIPILVTLCPTGPEGYLDVIKVHSNDSATACGADDSCKEGTCVTPGGGGSKYCTATQSAKLIANQSVPCLKIVPQKAVNFGFVPLGTEGVRKVRLESCGSADVEISGLALADDKSGVFGVDTSKVGDLQGKPVAGDNLLKIKQNGVVEVNVVCTPEAEYIDPASGKPAPYVAKLGVVDNTIEPDKTLELSCWGTATNCPTAVASCQQGELIVPQTEVTLVGSQSFAGPNQKIAKFEWKVTKQPKGSEADHVFWPNANTADPKFGTKTKKKDFSGAEVEVISVNIAGEYVFELEVTDDAGNKSCQKAVFALPVIPDEDIHVELLWTTPEDKDKKDTGLGAGADMDLHFAHSKANDTKICQDPPEMCGSQPCYCLGDLDKDGKVDPFFHSLYDCFWFNPDPNWGTTDPSVDDNPGLDLDDTDGWGPENLNLKNAENSATYTVGVHYWDAHGYGDSVATVRIYVLGQLVGEYESTTLSQCDMWWVKQIEWPSGNLLDVGGANGKVTKKYFPKFAKSLGAKCSD
jgi:hypothetical protein